MEEQVRLLKCQALLDETAAIRVGDLAEVKWQAAIMYSQKAAKAKAESKPSIEGFNKELAESAAMDVWRAYGFNEDEIRQHLEAFYETILADGGTYESVSDYFAKVMSAGTFYPSYKENGNEETGLPPGNWVEIDPDKDLYEKAVEAYKKVCDDRTSVKDKDGNIIPFLSFVCPSELSSEVGRKYVHLRNSNGDIARYVIKTGEIIV